MILFYDKWNYSDHSLQWFQQFPPPQLHIFTTKFVPMFKGLFNVEAIPRVMVTSIYKEWRTWKCKYVQKMDVIVMSFVNKNYTSTCPIEEVLGIWMDKILGFLFWFFILKITTTTSNYVQYFQCAFWLFSTTWHGFQMAIHAHINISWKRSKVSCWGKP
jgi:hypothetical protein